MRRIEEDLEARPGRGALSSHVEDGSSFAVPAPSSLRVGCPEAEAAGLTDADRFAYLTWFRLLHAGRPVGAERLTWHLAFAVGGPTLREKSQKPDATKGTLSSAYPIPGRRKPLREDRRLKLSRLTSGTRASPTLRTASSLRRPLVTECERAECQRAASAGD